MSGSPSTVRPRVNDLAFRLYARSLHPELFERQAVRRVRRAGFTLTAAILPSGHTLEWCHDGVTLFEVLTAAGHALPESGLRLHHPVDGGRRGRCRLSERVNYEMSLTAEVLAPEVFAHVHEEMAHDGAKRGLLFHFPPGPRLGRVPLSYLTVEPIAAGLAVSAFHTFPDEFTVVKSQSLIEFPTAEAFGEG